MAERHTLPGTIVGFRYELIEVAGEGGMATVWRAIMRGAQGFERPVAVKRMKPEFRAVKNYIDMFVEEARVGSELAHPNIVQVHDFCQDESAGYYLVMEWVDGVDLHSYIYSYARKGKHTPWAPVVSVGVGALRGLAAAHDRRRADGTLAPIIHRDISPQNILLGLNGTVKLTDFGLARAKDRAFSLTGPGVVKGKLSYLAPEITRGQPASPQTDIFAMASCLWEALAGERLFKGDSDLEVFTQIRNGSVRSLADIRSDLPPSLVQTIHKALLTAPEQRHSSAREFANELAQTLQYASSGDGQAMLAETVRWVKETQSSVIGATLKDESTWSFVIDVDFGELKSNRDPEGDDSN